MVTRPETVTRRTLRAGVHLVFGTRSWVRRNLEDFAKGIAGKTILEIGSGRQDLGEDAFSFQELFGPSNQFIQSDVVPEYGHEIVDVRDIEVEAAYDVILCLYVLEHVFELDRSVQSMHRALKAGGTLVIAVPHLYPYHDEPTDYWRFTEYGLRELLESFDQTRIEVKGFRKMPVALMAFARKHDGS